jgi:hypothetical protein
VSQQNFDSQWIATNGKDALNAMGIGAFFNVMNFGQMLMWHIVLIPIVLVAIIGAHVLLVRVRGVSHPLPERRTPVRGRAARQAAAAADAGPWRGPNRRYDILKEGTIATVIVTALVLVMAGVLSSPDVPPVTVQTWARIDQVGFVNTAATELDGTGGAASYGPPYNNQSGSVQQVGPVNWQKLAGITQPVNAARDFVLSPLSVLARTSPALASALSTYNSAPPAQQQKWASAYDAATAPGAKKVPFNNGDLNLPAAGPVPALMSAELAMARNGALDSDLLAQRQFYGTNFTKPLLFIADGGYYNTLASNMHLTGDQWGVMNETGSYPGQPWLWLFQLWYHVSPFASSASVDIWAVYLTGICTILLLLIPFIPGLRDIPRLIPVHRLIWRSWYRSAPGASTPASTNRPAAPGTSPTPLPTSPQQHPRHRRSIQSCSPALPNANDAVTGRVPSPGVPAAMAAERQTRRRRRSRPLSTSSEEKPERPLKQRGIDMSADTGPVSAVTRCISGQTAFSCTGRWSARAGVRSSGFR